MSSNLIDYQLRSVLLSVDFWCGEVWKDGRWWTCFSRTMPLFGSNLWETPGAFPQLLFCGPGWFVGLFGHCRAVGQLWMNSSSNCWWILQRVFVAGWKDDVKRPTCFSSDLLVKIQLSKCMKKLVPLRNMMLSFANQWRQNCYLPPPICFRFWIRNASFSKKRPYGPVGSGSNGRGYCALRSRYSIQLHGSWFRWESEHSQ